MTASLLKEIKRQRLQTLARAFTERNHLAVQFASNVATDIERTVYLKELDGEIVPGVPATPAECWMVMKAGCAHESGHVLFTDRKAWEDAVSRGLLFQHIVNVLEDARIERAVANAYPGTLNWLRFKNEYLCRNREDCGEGAVAFLWGLCSYAAVGRVPDALDPETRNLVEKCKPFVDEARLARNTWEVLDHAEKVHALAKDAFPAPSLPPVTMTGTDSPREAPRGPLDPRPVKRRKQQENSNSPEEPQQSKVGGQTDGEGDPEDTGGESSPDESPSDNPGDTNSGGEENPGKETGSDPASGGEAEPETSGEDSEEGTGDSGESAGEGNGRSRETDSTSTEDGDSDDSGERGTGNDTGETGDDETGDGESPASECRDNGENSGTEDDDPNGRDGNDGGEGDDSGRDIGFGDQNGGGRDLDDSEESAGDQDDEADPQSPESGESEAGESSEDEAAEDEEPEDPATPDPGEDEEDGFDVSSLLEEAEGELSAMAAAAERQEKESARGATPKPDWDEVREEVSKDLHKGATIKWHNIPPLPEEYQALVQAQQGTVRRLVEEIRKALEFRTTVPRRNLKKGRLDAGSLWKLRVPDPRVFSRREVPGDVPAVAVYLLVDCSGSMSNYQHTSQGTSAKNKITIAKEAAAVLHEACVVLGVSHTVVGFDSSRCQNFLYRAVDWNERHGTKISSFRAGRNNRDGYVIRVVSRELELRPEPRKILIVLSDGLPNDSPWGGDYDIAFSSLPVADTARAVRELEKRGIGVVGLFFGDEKDVPRARTIYKNFVYVQDVGHLPVILGRVLKQVVTGGA